MVKPIHAPPSARRNRAEPILARLRREILLGRQEPGERLAPERELAGRLGTNRNTLREALRTLEAENLVRARQGDGTIVLDWRATGEVGLLPAFLAEETPAIERIEAVTTLLQLRTILIEQAIPQAVKRADDDDWEEIEAAFDALRGSPLGPRGVLADVRLFRSVVLATHNLVLIWVFNTFSKIFVELGRRFPQLWRIDAAYMRAMDEFLVHLGDGKPERARTAMKRLLDGRAAEVTRQLRALTAQRADFELSVADVTSSTARSTRGRAQPGGARTTARARRRR